MKTRVHIHSVSIEEETKARQFIIMLPADAKQVIAVQTSVSFRPSPETSLRHIEAGRLRIARAGCLLYETAVRYAAIRARFPKVFDPSSFGINFNATTGGKVKAHNVIFPAAPRALFCLYIVNGGQLAHTLSIYFTYQTATP